jgi:hypothetical protein
MRLASRVEEQTDFESTEITALMNETASLKGEDLIAQAVVIDFMYYNIQSLKGQVYPAYLYSQWYDPSLIFIYFRSGESIRPQRGRKMLKGSHVLRFWCLMPKGEKILSPK